jgi:hypothetical protein
MENALLEKVEIYIILLNFLFEGLFVTATTARKKLGKKKAPT